MKPISPTDRALLIELVSSAHRERDVAGRVRSSPAFEDLDAAGRVEAYKAALASRELEGALDPEGRSTTVLAILRVVRRG